MTDPFERDGINLQELDFNSSDTFPTEDEVHPYFEDDEHIGSVGDRYRQLGFDELFSIDEEAA